MPVTWYDGDRVPPAEVQGLLGSLKFPGQGSIFIGTKGADVAAACGLADSVAAAGFCGVL